jgi:hypothetical protein
MQLTVGALPEAFVEGVVKSADGSPAGAATIAYVPTTSRAPFPGGIALADQIGSFILAAPPGEYRVFASKEALSADTLGDPESVPPDAQTMVLKLGTNSLLSLSLTK